MQRELLPLLLQWKASNSWAGSYQQERIMIRCWSPGESFLFLNVVLRRADALAGSQDLLHMQGSTWWVGEFALLQVKSVSCFLISYAKFGCMPKEEMIEMPSSTTFLSADYQGLPPALWYDLPEVWEVVEHEIWCFPQNAGGAWYFATGAQ